MNEISATVKRAAHFVKMVGDYTGRMCKVVRTTSALWQAVMRQRTARAKRKVRFFFPLQRPRTEQKCRCADKLHAHHIRRHWSLPLQSAPPAHPPCTMPASESPQKPRTQPGPPSHIQPLGGPRPTAQEAVRPGDSAPATAHPHAPQHLRVGGHDRAPAGRRRAPRRGCSAGRS